MRNARDLESISDDDLLRRLSDLLCQSRRTEADLVAHIGEVDARRLYAREAAPSMFAYCTEVLHLSEAEAYLRIAVARASRQHPLLLDMLADGRLHLTSIAKLAPHLTAENREALLSRAVHKTKRQIEGLVAEIEPRPDAPAVMRRLPERREPAPSTLEVRPDGAAVARGRAQVGLLPGPDGVDSTAAAGPELRPDGVTPAALQLRPDAVVLPPVARRPAVVEPLAPGRYRVQFTASAELHDKLERLRTLMRSSVPDGDLTRIIEEAVTEKLERLEARRFGRSATAKKAPGFRHTPPSGGGSRASRHIPAAVRRAVYERDGGRCRFVDEQGRRCTAREGLEFHHRHPFGHGGEHSVANVSLQCRAHNRHLAEVDYGRKAIAGTSRSGSRLRPQTASP
jgi:5-methylcytosine-specific restriction endonuclease McrA